MAPPPPTLNTTPRRGVHITGPRVPVRSIGRGLLAQLLNRHPSPPEDADSAATSPTSTGAPPAESQPIHDQSATPLTATIVPHLPALGQHRRRSINDYAVAGVIGPSVPPPKQLSKVAVSIRPQAPPLSPLKLSSHAGTAALPLPAPPLLDSRIAVRYSPEELECRQRPGIVSSALAEYHRSKSYTDLAAYGVAGHGVAQRQIHSSRSVCPIIVDSSDEEHRGGILGRSLSKQKRREARKASGRGSTSTTVSSSSSEGAGHMFRRKRHSSRLGGGNSKRRGTSHMPGFSSGYPESEEDEYDEQALPEFTEEDRLELTELAKQAENGVLPSRLLYLCKLRHWEQVLALLRSASFSQLDLNCADRHGLTPLLLAVKHSRVDVLEMLLSVGADQQMVTREGMTALHVCARWGNANMLLTLIEKGLDVKCPAGMNDSWPIHIACERKSKRACAIVDCLLQANEACRLAMDKSKSTPLHLAIRASNEPVIRVLLEKEADAQIRRRDGDGNTPMHLASHQGLEMVALVSEAGGASDINTQNALGQTPLHEVARLGDEKMLKTMWKLNASANVFDNEDRSPLHLAAEQGHTQMVETLIDKFGASVRARTTFLKRGVPLYMPNKMGALALHSAAAAGYNDVVKMLIARGTRVDIPTGDNFTALHVAVKSGQASVVETLLGYGADVHIHGGQNGQTPLHVAAALIDPTGNKSDVECAKMLLKSGAQANVMQEDGQTPLHIAARNGNADMVRLLLREGADPQLKANNCETPLHVAARNCFYEVTTLILQHVSQRADPLVVKNYVNSFTEDGETSLHHASMVLPNKAHYKCEDAKLIGILLDHGGTAPIQTSETPMHLAASSGNETTLLAIVDKIGPGQVQIIQNKKSKNGWTPLLEACARGHVGVACILLQEHARIDVFDDNGRTALHLSCANGHLELSKILLENKAFVNSKSKYGEAPLHLAAQNGHIDIVNLLIKDHAATLEAVTLNNQTPLHFAARYGQLALCQTLLALGANPNAKDDKGQTPLHLAAENDFPDVVKLFLKMKQFHQAALTAVDQNGFTCAHIAAMKGSLAVVKELMMIDKPMVIHAKTKTMEATTLHMASGGGHEKIVKLLLENGSNPEAENGHGMTALHLGAKNGHVSILGEFDKAYWRRCSRKTGLNALHIAANNGQTDFVSEMLTVVPATVRSEPPLSNHLVVKEFATEYGFTPLHMAAQSGHDSLVRMLLNQGVQVDAASTTMSVIPLHLAAQQGHIAVVGMLLSRSTQQQHAKDYRGRTAIHLAALNGHSDMVSLLIAQGSNINVMDQNGWTGMHYATRAGHTEVVKLFVSSSADPQAETKEGKVPLCFAASYNHLECLRFLLQQKHDTYQLMEDRKFIFDLMVCGKNSENEPLQEFILQSPAPIDTAVKLSSLYREMSEKEKERAKDLGNVAVFAENLAVELLAITAAEYNAALLLKAKDVRGKPLLDVFIENEQKEVVSHASVQRYLTEIWNGKVDWAFGKSLSFALLVLLCPPAWFYFSLPLNSRIGRAPIIKFVCHIVSHIYFTVLLTLVVLNITHKMYEVTTPWPNPVEWLLLLWLSGNLVTELSSVGGSSGLGVIKILILILAAAAIAVHCLAFILPTFYLTNLDNDEKLHFVRTLLYLKNQLFAFALLFAFVEFLDFLTVHHLFGPWAIIIRDLMYDLTRFLVILMLFVAGFTLHVTSIFQPAYQPVDEESAELMRLGYPSQTLEMLFFSLFGLVEQDNMPPLHLVPDFAKIVLKLLFGIYLLVTLIVLINLLIAMMSDTYQRIQAQSDKEWKFGRAILIRQMNKRAATPAPINMLTKFYIVMKVAWRNKFKMCTQQTQKDLRHEEDIDAFSMSGDQGRHSPTFFHGGEGDMVAHEEMATTGGTTLDTVINWSLMVKMYYQTIGKRLPISAEEEEMKRKTGMDMGDKKGKAG